MADGTEAKAGGDSIRVELLGAVVERPLAAGETPDVVAEAVRRIGELLELLPDAARLLLRDEAVVRIATRSASLRKLEKKVRQAAIAGVARDRMKQISDLAPDIRIDDLRGTVRFAVSAEESVVIDGTVHRVPVRARVAGGALERSFLLHDTDTFIDEARTVLGAQLEAARLTTRQAAGAIDALIGDRAGRPLYNVQALHRIVARALREADDLDDALERITFGVEPLDRDAAQRERVRALVEERGLIAYRDYFPQARALRRELVLYVGPTNSGKTWRALNELAASASGSYLAPLRLLALEGQEELEKRGRVASYITGEERDIREEATIIASTIEMIDTTRVVDVAVIDEIQLLVDEDRGWAWCQALVAAPARRVIMTGSPDCVPLVQELAHYLGEPLTVEHLERHTPIEAVRRPLSLADIEPGTAVIAFSRRDVLALKALLEPRFAVAVIYGNLTPEVRREEARRFRAGEAQVVVSTDAIAMGLNLPIATVCFSTLEKWNGRDWVQLAPWEILQIGGRAGRFGHFERGRVGALDRRDAQRVAEVFAPGYTLPPRPIVTTVRPGADHIEVIAAGLGTPRLAKALAAFQRGMTFDSPLLAPGVHDDVIKLAELVDWHRSIPLAERLTLASAPLDTRLEWLTAEYGSWVEARARDGVVRLAPLRSGFTRDRASDDGELIAAEMEAKRLTLYSWLGYRFAETFPDLDECSAQRVELDRFIERSLAQRGGRRLLVCRVCGDRLPRRWRDDRCATCRRGAERRRTTGRRR
jgi:ATP-dependent RNA helicase SUPV3L1/SUV3